MKCRYPILIALLLIASLFAEDRAIRSFANAVGIQPIRLIKGVGLNYEHVFRKKYGVFLEGTLYYGHSSRYDRENYDVGIQYRHHIHRKRYQIGMSSPYWGVLVNFGKRQGSSSLVVTANDYSMSSTEDVSYTQTSVRFGGVFGRRWIFGNGFTFNLQCGYAFLPVSDYVWDDEGMIITDHSKENAESIVEFPQWMALECSVGFAF